MVVGHAEDDAVDEFGDGEGIVVHGYLQQSSRVLAPLGARARGVHDLEPSRLQGMADRASQPAGADDAEPQWTELEFRHGIEG